MSATPVMTFTDMEILDEFLTVNNINLEKSPTIFEAFNLERIVVAGVEIRKSSVSEDRAALSQYVANRLERCQGEIVAALDRCKNELQGATAYVKFLIWASNEVNGRIGQAVQKN